MGTIVSSCSWEAEALGLWGLRAPLGLGAEPSGVSCLTQWTVTPAGRGCVFTPRVLGVPANISTFSELMNKGRIMLGAAIGVVKAKSWRQNWVVGTV